MRSLPGSRPGNPLFRLSGNRGRARKLTRSPLGHSSLLLEQTLSHPDHDRASPCVSSPSARLSFVAIHSSSGLSRLQNHSISQSPAAQLPPPWLTLSLGAESRSESHGARPTIRDPVPYSDLSVHASLSIIKQISMSSFFHSSRDWQQDLVNLVGTLTYHNKITCTPTFYIDSLERRFPALSARSSRSSSSIRWL